MRETESEDIREEWERENRMAQALGVFEVPTCIVDGEMFWGNDRLEFMEELLCAGSVGAVCSS